MLAVRAGISRVLHIYSKWLKMVTQPRATRTFSSLRAGPAPRLAARAIFVTGGRPMSDTAATPALSPAHAMADTAGNGHARDRRQVAAWRIGQPQRSTARSHACRLDDVGLPAVL